MVDMGGGIKTWRGNGGRSLMAPHHVFSTSHGCHRWWPDTRRAIRQAASAHGKKTPISPLIGSTPTHTQKKKKKKTVSSRPAPLAAAPSPSPLRNRAVLMFFFSLFFPFLFFPKDEQIVRMCCRLATSTELRVSGSTRRAAEMGLGRLLCIRQPRGKIQTSTFFFLSFL